MVFPTVDLLFLLKEARTVRSDTTDEIRKLKKKNQNTKSAYFEENYDALNKEYTFVTKKCMSLKTFLKQG